MTNEFPRLAGVDREDSQTQIDLLETLLEPDDAPYPWNPADPEAEAYFASLEEEFSLEDWSEEEMTLRTQTFFTKLDRVWLDPADFAAIESTLQQRFVELVPQSWLNAIAHNAYQFVSTQRSIADQLVQCMQDILPNWAEEDLLVLARPFAYAMRGKETEAIRLALDRVQPQTWTQLSEIEQARTGLAIARFTLDRVALCTQKGQGDHGDQAAEARKFL